MTVCSSITHTHTLRAVQAPERINTVKSVLTPLTQPASRSGDKMSPVRHERAESDL